MSSDLTMLTPEALWWIGLIAALVVCTALVALSLLFSSRAPVTERSSPLTGLRRLQIDATALAAAGWPNQVYRLPNGQVCLRVPMGRSAGRPVDAFLLVRPDYPVRPPQVLVATGRQQLPLYLPSLDVWSADSSLVRLVEDVALQLPGVHRMRARHLTREGELR